MHRNSESHEFATYIIHTIMTLKDYKSNVKILFYYDTSNESLERPPFSKLCR
jgi:hypothetical protein